MDHTTNTAISASAHIMVQSGFLGTFLLGMALPRADRTQRLRSRSLMGRLVSGIVALACCTGLGLMPAAEGTGTWVGNQSRFFFERNNWSGFAVPIFPIFGAAGSSGTTLINDFFGQFSNCAGITFNAGAAAFTILNSNYNTGVATLTGNVTNNSTSLQTIDIPFNMTAVRTFTTSAGGGNITMGLLTGTGGGITKLGAGTMTLARGINYTGATTVQGGTLEVAGTTTTPTANITVGGARGDLATLKIAGGFLSNTNGFIGYDADSTGTATVSSGSWTNSGDLTVGNSGLADRYSFLGATGVLNISGGAVSNSIGYLGLNVGSTGTATVSSGTWTNTDSLTVGNSGTGELNVTGGTVSSFKGVIGNNADSFFNKISGSFVVSSGTATISGGTWTNTDSLTVGSSGTGVLNVTGGAVSSGLSYIGANAGSSGTATVSSGTWTTGDLTVGGSGTGVLNVTGGTVSNRYHSHIGSNAGSSGTVTVSSGRWTNGSDLTVGDSGTGVLNITGSGVVSAGMFILGYGSTGAGTLNLGTGGAAGTLDVLFVATGNGTGVVNFNHTGGYTFTQNLGGSLSVNKLGAGITTLTAANNYTGATTVSNGTLVVDGSIAASSLITVDSGAALGGHGIVSAIAGAGTVAPGNSPGILTAIHLDPSGGLDFAFQLSQLGSPDYTNASASGNDVLHLTGLTPFDFPLNNTNVIAVDFTGYGTLFGGEVFRGGFYADFGGDFISQIENATFSYTGLGAGESVIVDTFQELAHFNTGDKTGWVTQFTIISSAPEPSRALLLLTGVCGCLLRRRRQI